MKKAFFIILLFTACKEVYTPTLKHHGYNYLVVEGDIVTNDSTFVHLTRTIPVADSSTVQAETGADIKVEGESGETYQLQSVNNGLYVAAPLPLSLNERYRLHIFTSSGKEYISDFASVKQTLPIDSVSWKLDEGSNVNIYVSTHDATAASQYYRWEYDETWEHRSKYSSELIYDPAIHYIRSRLPEEQVYRCWNKNLSGEILIASTAGLSSDVVFEKPILIIPYASEKISRVYSILVKQHALSKEAYEYWDNLKKNTETIGSIFDPQPFADFGNIHCVTDPSEPVIGFIGAGSSSEKRIYIDWPQVQWPYPVPGCLDTTVVPADIEAVFSGYTYLPVMHVLSPPGAVFGSTQDCVDCKLTGGGSTVKPPYMP
jgi:hypothetical protein